MIGSRIVIQIWPVHCRIGSMSYRIKKPIQSGFNTLPGLTTSVNMYANHPQLSQQQVESRDQCQTAPSLWSQVIVAPTQPVVSTFQVQTAQASINPAYQRVYEAAQRSMSLTVGRLMTCSTLKTYGKCMYCIGFDVKTHNGYGMCNHCGKFACASHLSKSILTRLVSCPHCPTDMDTS